MVAGQKITEAIDVGNVDRERARDAGMKARGCSRGDVITGNAADCENVGVRGGALGACSLGEVALNVGAKAGG